MAVISIHYDEPNTLDYTSVDISFFNNDKKKFNSGDFVKDWFDALKFFVTGDFNNEHFMYSSSVNHFIMDGAPFESSYLRFDKPDGEPYLTKDYGDGKGMELFVEEGKDYTWLELKERCK